jgi:DNA mismatch endonuclease, patch repair protein
MSRIRSRRNKETELRLVSIFRDYRITGWRREQKLVGKPDFIFRRERIAIFVDGCFWHGCPQCYRAPSSNVAYWNAKRERNSIRDRKVNAILRRSGWRVIRIWEHQLENPGDVIRQLQRARQRFLHAAKPHQHSK